LLFQASMNMIKNLPVSEDYSEVLLEVSKSLDNFSAQYIKDIITKNVSF
jgi:kinesin family member 16B